MSPPVLVTGATGNTGRLVVDELERRGSPLRRARSRMADEGSAADPRDVHLDVTRPQTFRRAVEGCDAVFLLRPPAISDVGSTLNPFIDAARGAGVRHIVFLSVAGAAENRFVLHHAVEQHLMAGEGGWTVLRPGFFAQNLASAYLDDIVHEDRLYVPAGSGLVAFVDLRDVAQVAVDALLHPEAHRGVAYTLTGPSAHTFAEVATYLTEATGRPIRYQPASMPGYLRHLRRAGLSWGHCAVQTVLHVGLRWGQAEEVDPTLATLLDRKPTGVERYVHDHADVWV